MKKRVARVYQLDNQKFLSEEEHQELKRVLNLARLNSPRDVLLIELSLATGARETELLNTTKGSLNKRDKTILIRGIKGSEDREIPLRDDLWNRLTEYVREKPENEKLFLISARRYRQIWDQFRPVKKKLHALRHTFAIELFKKHKDLRLVQVALGHRNIANTMIYSQYVYKTEELRRLIC